MPIVLTQSGISKGGGESEEIIIGTGTSHPAGIEAFFEYNGLVMNDRRVLDTYLILSIDGFADPDIRDSRQVNPVYHGETAFNAWYGGRTIVMQGRIRAHEIRKLRDMQESLKQVFAGLQEIPLRIASNFADQTIEINCRKSQALAMTEVQQNRMFHRDFMLTLRASDPRFRSVNQAVYTGVNTGTAFTPFTAVNKGNHRAQPIISIGGPVQGPKIFNATNNEAITFIPSAVIPANDVITIDILKRTVVDQNGNNKFFMLDVSSDWPEIDPGDNIIEYTGLGMTGSSTFGIKFKHAWL